MAREPFDGDARWIWGPGGTWDPPSPPGSPFRVCYFRRTFDAPDGADLTVHASADSEYVLFLNGERVSRGPAKGDVDHQYYETVGVSDGLRAGENALAAVVVSYAPSWEGPTSRMTATNAFILDGVVRSGGEVVEAVHTDDRWRALPDEAYGHRRRESRASLAGVDERRDDRAYPRGWREPEYDGGDWSAAVELEAGTRRDDDHHWHRLPYRLVPRSIPPLEKRPERFDDVFGVDGIDDGEAAALLRGEGSLSVPANASARFVADAGAVTTGFPVVETAGGRGAEIDLTYAEALAIDGEKSRVHDPERGVVAGHGDTYVPAGGEGHYEPLSWRAFRYVAVEIETGDEPLEVDDLRYRFAAYPFAERASFDAARDYDRLWDAAWRTVRLCAHETFEDCPYYEQLQYAGDTHPVSLFAGYVSGDWRLARQAVRQFDWSRDDRGVTKSRYPSRVPQHIPSWSLLWVQLVRDYWWHAGDAETTREVLDGIDSTLRWFADFETDDGVVADLPGWKVVDWVPGWEPRGVPPGAMDGVSAVINLQYAAALSDAAELHGALGDDARARTYRKRVDRVTAFVNRRCWDADRERYVDRPGGDEVSELGNAWAILAGAAEAERASAVAESIAADDDLARATLYGRYYVLRALREAGRYDLADGQLERWDEILEGTDLTTLPERETTGASHCHAWSSSPLYEFLAEVCGVKPAAPGFECLRIAPQPLDLAWAEGTVPTPAGEVSVRWERGDGFSLTVASPDGVGGVAVLPDGTEAAIPPGGTRLEL